MESQEEEKGQELKIEEPLLKNTGYCEMNIPFDMTETGDAIKMAELAKFICNGINDGYTTFVVTHSIDHDLSPKDECNFDPKDLNIKERYQEYCPESIPLHKEFNMVSSLDKVRILTRLDVRVENQKIAHQLMNSMGGGSNTKSAKIIHTYDILSASTSDDKCLDLLIQKSDVDIISLDLCEFLKFFFNKKTLKQAVSKNIFFEISYAKAISDSVKYRKNFIGKSMDLVECIKSKNIIFSCGSGMQILHRNPHDTISLASMVGLSQANARKTVTTNCEKCIQRGNWRKSFKGACNLVSDKEIDDNKEYQEVLAKKGKSLLDEDFDEDMQD